MAPMPNPLLSDRSVDFLLGEVFDVPSLCGLPYFADHSPATFALFLSGARRLARELLFPAYRAMDVEPPRLDGGRVSVHPKMKEIYRRLVETGIITATRPVEVGGQQLPLSVAIAGQLYLMAANLSAYGYLGLTTGAAHLCEAFGDERVRRDFMEPLYRGEWTGTMALTEPQAGSSLADVKTRATPSGDHYTLRGSKIFISGGDHDLTDNIVHLTLARIDGAPDGIRGVSLFAVPKRRREGGALVDNDVQVAGMIHKIGWRGLPSLVLELGTNDDCHGFLVGEPHKGIPYMFQMMNEARIMVGANGVATASVAFHEALEYARVRPQGRPVTARDPSRPQVPIIEHADVRRMLLRQKAIVEGGLALVMQTALFADRAAHAATDGERHRARLLLDLMTPIAKSFPAERGFESNALAVQVHGGYGYSSEFLVESWLRDQKLNSLHEGTTGIQAMDLLGRKVVAEGGAALALLREEITTATENARARNLLPEACAEILDAVSRIERTTATLAGLGLAGDADAMMRHASDFLELCSIVVVAWLLLRVATAAQRALDENRGDDFHRGQLAAARYWMATELPRAPQLAALCAANDDSYASMQPGWF
jgi:butyryl-CoA dehydrogenase